MKSLKLLAGVALVATLLGACSGRQIQAWDTTLFEAGNYRYYSWRTDALENATDSLDEVYRIDAPIRSVVNQLLAEKGYVYDPDRAQFSVDYIYAPGLQLGVPGDDTTNLYTRPGVGINRRIDGASVDNAYALAGVRETRSVALQFNDVARTQEVWRVIVTEITGEIPADASEEKIRNHVEKALRKATRDLPKSS